MPPRPLSACDRARVLVACFVVAGPGVVSAGEPAIDFSTQVRPILSEHCFACHGPDEAKRKGDLRLDLRESALKAAKSGAVAVVPGRPAQSELITRIATADADERMPPKHQLTSAQVETLKRWIEQGAEYRPHWAFTPIRRPALPVPATPGWARNGIDHFVLARLEREGLKPQAEAGRETLIRRLALDLTGLPPTPAEVDAFVKDASPDAYGTLVDRMLASPRYGERMAMPWLDGARYADSHGFQGDSERFMWRWREWVIDAFNADQPFDQFTIEQLAGDLLPNATIEQKVATGFNRNHRINEEGGAIDEEWRVENVVDRVETTSTVWLGLTMGCARCHDHKYDPVSQKEFFQFFAFFNSISEKGMGKKGNAAPVLKAPRREDAERAERLRGELARAEAAARGAGRTDPAGFAAALLARAKDAGAAPALHLAFDEAAAAPGAKRVPGRLGGAIQFDGKGAFAAGDRVAIAKDKPLTLALWANLPAKGGGPLIAKLDNGRGLRVALEPDARLRIEVIGDQSTFTTRVRSRDPLRRGVFVHVVASTPAAGRADDWRLLVDGEEVELATDIDLLALERPVAVPLQVGGDGKEGLAAAIDEVRLYERALGDAEARVLFEAPLAAIARLPAAQRSPEQAATLAAAAQASDPAQRAVARLRKELAAVENSPTDVMVMEELPKPRDTFVLIRGQYDQRGEKVEPGTPSFLPPFPAGAPRNRLGLARWITDPGNPLTARVAVNRWWELLFGAGLVATSENFGVQAEVPSHGDLLDWLAAEFVADGWSIKRLLRTLVTSATYRQSSVASAAATERDPHNRLLARGARFRLPAEMLRDQALLMAGLLVEKRGGPNVRPYQPDGIWDETNFYGNLRNYKADTGEGLWRRSMYTIWKRTAAPPNMTTFDMPSREYCVVRRSRTNTPLQALVALNDPTYVEAARVLAQRVMAAAPAPEARLTLAFRHATARAPSAAELRVLLAGHQRRAARFRSDPAAAGKLLGVGASPAPAGLDPAELAAYAATCAVILNLDETLTRE